MYDLESSSVDPPEEYDVDSSLSGSMERTMTPETAIEFFKKPETQKWFKEESKLKVNFNSIIIINLT